MRDAVPAFLDNSFIVPRKVAEDRGLKAWITPEDMPADARVELNTASGYEEARFAQGGEVHDPVQGERR